MAATAGIPLRPLEITDLLWSFGVDGQREAVVAAEVRSELLRRGQNHAAKLVDRMPQRDGMLDPKYVDALGIRVHCELQRLSEELQLGRRVAEELRRIIKLIRRSPSERFRIVDLGCGTGHLIRSLAVVGELGNVELLGIDYNAVLVAEAERLSAVEGLDCRFATGNALATGSIEHDEVRSIIVSTGVVHHLDPQDLGMFFRAHERADIAAFAHWDLVKSPIGVLGAWVFHQARMREAVSRHDGVLSVKRAHRRTTLLRAAECIGEEFDISVLRASPPIPPALDVLRPIVGVRR